MEEEYPRVVSEWESATIEMVSLPLQLERKLEQKRQLKDMIEKLRKENSSDNEKSLHIQISLHREKYLRLEKEIESFNHAILKAAACERNAHIHLFKAVFSDHSTKCIQQTCRRNMKILHDDLETAHIMMDETLKKLNGNSKNYFESHSLREEVSRLADIIELKELDMKTKSKVLELFTILHSGISVQEQWCNAEQNLVELTPKIKMWYDKLELQVLTQMEEKQQKQKYQDLVKDLMLERDRELKTIKTFRSILTKLEFVESCENKSDPQEDKECIPEKQSTNILCKKENITNIEKYQDREDYTDQKELKLEEENLEDSQNKQKNFNLANESENKSDRQEDKECIPEKQSTNVLCKKENITNIENNQDREDLNDQKELKLEEENLEDNQNKQKNFNLANERFQNQYGIIIESRSRQDLSYKADPWNSDERLDVLEKKEFPDMFQLCTDIFHIRESTAVDHLKGATVQAKDVRLKVLLPKENSPYHEYKGAVKVGNSWMLIDYNIQDCYMVFEVDQVDSFCVLSLARQEIHTILPDGSQFISEVDDRIQIIFPPNAVMKEEHITFMIHPFNISCILERTTNTGLSINAITPGVSTIHMEFKEMFKVQLPLHSISNTSGNTQDYMYYIFKWNDDGSLKFIDLQPSERNGLVCFETNSFSGYGCVGTPRFCNPSNLESVVQEAYGLKKWCKILFFVGKLKTYNLPIMLECVELQRVEDVCKKRENYGYHFVSDWISKDFFLSPYKTIISVEVKGMFRIPTESGVKKPRLTFIPSARDNFTRFLVYLVKRGTITHGVLALKVRNKILDEIYYDPDTDRQIIPPKKIGNRGKQTARPPIKQSRSVRVFFTERGLLALSKSMSPDTMFEVCINMNMTTASYDTLQQKYGIGSVRGYIALWNTALDQQPHNKKLENLIKALVASGQKSLADKVQLLQSTGKDLDEF